MAAANVPQPFDVDDVAPAAVGLAQRFLDFAATGDPDMAAELFTDDFVAHTIFGPMRGGAAYAEMVGLFPRAFPDAQLTLLQTFSTDKHQLIRFRTLATHTGEGLPGVAPTGQRLHMIETHVQALAGGRIAQDHVSQGNFNLARLLFGLPLPPQDDDPTFEPTTS